MKTRIISGAVILALAIPLILFSSVPYVLNTVIGLLCALSVYEALSSMANKESKLFLPFAVTFALGIPFIPPLNQTYLLGIVLVMVLIAFSLIIFSNNQLNLLNIATALVVSVIIPLFFTCIMYLRRIENSGKFYIWLVFICAWATDTAAYFFGLKFGKHKMSPIISPKKTIEGSIGGTITGVICHIICVVIIAYYYKVNVNYFLIVISGIMAAIIGQIGDLSMSAIKRAFNVKDFGGIIPGHGGILDRFDSVLFIAPFLYVFFTLFPAITV